MALAPRPRGLATLADHPRTGRCPSPSCECRLRLDPAPRSRPFSLCAHITTVTGRLVLMGYSRWFRRFVGCCVFSLLAGFGAAIGVVLIAELGWPSLAGAGGVVGAVLGPLSWSLTRLH